MSRVQGTAWLRLCLGIAWMAAGSALAEQIVPEQRPPQVPVQAGPPRYRWLPKTVYRFQYEKRIEVKQDTPGLEPLIRVTEMQGVLVFKTEDVESDGTANAEMALESVRLTLPPYRRYDDDVSKVREDAERGELLARVIEETFRELSWKVRLDAMGRVEVRSRQPEHLTDALHRLQRTLAVPRKSVQQLDDALQKDFGLKPGSVDAELLPALEQAPSAEGKSELERLRLVRRVSVEGDQGPGRLKLSLKREALSTESVKLDGLNDRAGSLTLRPGTVETVEGRAIFDTDTGMLDEAVERYFSSVECTNRERKMMQELNVTYRLKRLAPALRGSASTDNP